MRTLVHVWSTDPGVRRQSAALSGTSHDHAWRPFAQVNSHFGWLQMGAPGMIRTCAHGSGGGCCSGNYLAKHAAPVWMGGVWGHFRATSQRDSGRCERWPSGAAAAQRLRSLRRGAGHGRDGPAADEQGHAERLPAPRCPDGRVAQPGRRAQRAKPGSPQALNLPPETTCTTQGLPTSASQPQSLPILLPAGIRRACHHRRAITPVRY